MNRCVWIACVCALGSAPAVAQVDRVTCGSDMTLADHIELQLLFDSGIYDPPTAPVGAWEIPITFHVVRRSNGTGGATQGQIDQAMIDLNSAFAPAGMVFCQMGPVQYLDSDAFYFDIDSDEEIRDLKKTNPVPGTINVYTTENLANDDFELCGDSSFTWFGTQGIVMWNGCFGIAGNLRFAHEVGHYFNLMHTHEVYCCDCFLNTCVECVDGSNCACCGDAICDTPADPLLYDIQAMEFLVNGNCQYTGQIPSPCQGDPPYDPDVTNIMAYAPSNCVVDFTPLQNNRMIATLIHKRFELVTTDCAYSGSCGAGAGPCPEPHGGQGCLDATCCTIVCDSDPTCCDTAWDLDCALLAQQLCDLGPDNDDCDDAKPLYSDPQFVAFDTIYAGTDGPSHPECNGQLDSDIWFNYKSPCTGDLTLSLCDSADFDTRLAVYGTLNCPVSFFDLIGCSDDGAGCGGGTSEITLPVILDELIKIRVGGAGLAEGTGMLFFDCKTQFDDCDNPLVLFNYEGTVNVNTVGATSDGPAFCGTQNDIWMDYYPPCSGVLQIDRVADFNMGLAVYEDCGCPADFDELILCGGSSTFVVENQCYKIQVGGFGGDEGTGQVTFTCIPAPPNDNCADAIEVGPGDVIDFDTGGASTDGPHYFIECEGGNPLDNQIHGDIWYTFTAPCDATLTASTCGQAAFDTTIAIYQGCTCPVVDDDILVCSDNAPGCGATSEVTIDVVEGQCYMIRVGGAAASTGTGQLSIDLEPDCQGDANGDGIIGILDFLIVIGTWGQCPPPCPPSCLADFDGDCNVGVTDFLIVLANWT